MARMYSGSKGKSGSKKPINKESPVWMSYKPKEIEMLVVKLAKEGKSSSQIGLYLRDAYGIPNVKTIAKKSITEIMEEKKLLPRLPEDLVAIMRRTFKLRKHLEKNKHDQVAKRGVTLAESKIRRLVKYYKRSNKIAEEWKYNPEELNLYVS